MRDKAASTTVTREKIKLAVVRLSYPNLFKPRASNFGGEEKEPEYSASFILDKKQHAASIKEIQAAADRIAIAKWGKKPAKFTSPIRDGATFKNDDAEAGSDEEYKAGYGPSKMAVNAKNKAKQQMVLRDKSVASEEDLYGGCYVNTTITLFPWEHPKNGKGVSASLGPVQFVKDGERFGAAVLSADEEFEDLGEADPGESEDDDNFDID